MKRYDRSRRRILLAALLSEGALACSSATIHGQAVHPKPMSLIPARLEQLCVTEGQIQPLPNGTLRIQDTKVRAVFKQLTDEQVSLRFRYLGPTTEASTLRSGEQREQFGLKLRAANGCNVLYAMWRIKPEAKLVVQLKRNPNRATSAECGNEGYQTLKPRFSATVPALTPDAEHLLSAHLAGESLTVFVDDHSVWEGRVPAGQLPASGPVGLRTDNVQLEFALLTAVGREPYSCRGSDD